MKTPMQLQRQRGPAPTLTPIPALDRDDEMPLVEAFMRRLCRDEGFLGDVAVQHLDGGGKRIRAKLALAAAEGFGLDPIAAAPLAAACELLHNATLIHDDLQDGDRLRRGRPATWVVHGEAQAINAGDLMLMLPWAAVEHLSCPDATRWHLSRAIATRARACVSGQALEMSLAQRGRTDWEGWHEAARGKTGELLALPIEGAALLAGWSPERARALGDAFCSLGLLYQLRDDLIDLYGDKGRSKVGNDLREGKHSALVVEHLRLAPEDRAWLLRILTTPRDDTSDSDVEFTSSRFMESGAVRAVIERMQDLADELLGADVMQEAPAVRGIADGLIALLLRPIGVLDLERTQ